MTPMGIRNALSDALATVGVQAAVSDPVVGPTTIQYNVRHGRSVRALDGTCDDVVHVLDQAGIEATYGRDGGRRTYTIRRGDPQPVFWSDVVKDCHEYLVGAQGRYVVGMRPDGTYMLGDLADSSAPHLLVAGQSGSGKSVWLQSFAACLAHGSAHKIWLALVDPKRVTFTSEAYLRLLGDSLETIEYDARGVVPLLDAAIATMECRYQLMADHGAIDLPSYNALGRQPLNRCVVIVDEYQDIITDRGRKGPFERAVARLCAKARAVGIHLVLATQRPDRDTITPSVKANLGGKIAFRVATGGNSRVILDAMGAESLLGKGDLLADLGRGPQRAQGPYIPT